MLVHQCQETVFDLPGLLFFWQLMSIPNSNLTGKSQADV